MSPGRWGDRAQVSHARPVLGRPGFETRVSHTGRAVFCTALHLHVTGLANTDSKTRIDDTVRPDNIGTVNTKNSPRHVSRTYKLTPSKIA